MKSVLITGCNRGIGLGLIRHLVKEKNPPKTLIATCRSIAKAEDLRQIADQNENVKLLELDVTNFEAYEDFSGKVGDLVKEDGLNVLINNAGVSPKSTRIQFVKAEQMMDTFKVNTIAPVLLTKALIPWLKKAAKANAEKPLGAEKSLVVNMTSILGSIAKNVEGGLYPYRCSKVALNMATKSLSVDLYKYGILVACVHPGWVKTDMGGSNAPMEVDSSASGIISTLHTLNESHTGGFYQWDGTRLEW